MKTALRPTALPATALLTLFLILACASPLDEARSLATSGKTDQALAQVEALLADKPDDALSLEALGDIHLMAMGGPGGDPEHATGAVDAYRRAADSQRLPGIYKAKQALAELLAGQTEAAAESARKALSCCSTAAALPLVDQPQVLERAVEIGSWTLDPGWRSIGAFEQAGPQRLILKQDAPKLVALDAFEVPTLSAGYSAAVDAVGPPIRFTDRTHPQHAKERGYVRGLDYCDQPHMGFACRGRMIRDRKAEIHAGPCWHAEEPPEEHLVVVPADEVSWNSVHCVAGRPSAQRETCPGVSGSCEVEFDRITFGRFEVAAADVWLMPLAAPSPHAALPLAHDVAGESVVEHLVRGELTLGLPEPLARWAARTEPAQLPSDFVLTKGSITVSYESPHGRFTFTDGALSAWKQP
jgi:hypothetical protein